MSVAIAPAEAREGPPRAPCRAVHPGPAARRADLDRSGEPHPVPPDASLPQLGRAVDAECMRAVFDEALRGRAAQRVIDCRVDRIKYRPGRSCTVSYRLSIRDERGSGVREQLAAGRFCAVGEGPGRHARNVHRVSRPTACGVSSLLVQDLDLFAWFLPNDPKLVAMPLLWEIASGGRRALAEVLDAVTGGAFAPSLSGSALVRYVPESRACVRVDFDRPDGSFGRLYGKLQREGNPAAAVRVLRGLHDSPAQREGRLRTPAAVLLQPSGMYWQSGMEGDPLADLQWPYPPLASEALGRMLAALHATPVDLPRCISGIGLLPGPIEVAAMLGRVDPRWQPALRRVVGGLEAGAGAVLGLPDATLHGDLHPRNVLIDRGRLSLIDLDAAQSGPAVLDLGAWLADGYRRALTTGADPSGMQESAAHLLRGYRAESAAPAEGRALAWATARALLCEGAGRCVSGLRPGGMALVPGLLAIAETLLRRGDIYAPLAADRGLS